MRGLILPRLYKTGTKQMLVRKLRLQRGWSQEQLAEMVGVSVRTIQRIERGFAPGLETAKALASVFEVEFSTFISTEQIMDQGQAPVQKEVIVSKEEKEAMVYVKGVKEFYDHLLVYIVFVAVYGGLALFEGVGDREIILFGLAGWGIGVIIHSLVAFEKIRLLGLGPRWERAAIERRLGRKL
jgi:XRE family transcriptional regulator, regulator of sulfur utilization